MLCPILLIISKREPSLPVEAPASPPQAITSFLPKYEYEFPSPPVTISKSSPFFFISRIVIFVFNFTLSLINSSFRIFTNSFALSPAGYT